MNMTIFRCWALLQCSYICRQQFQEFLLLIDQKVAHHIATLNDGSVSIHHRLLLRRTQSSYPYLCRFKLLKNRDQMTEFFTETNNKTDSSYLVPESHFIALVRVEGIYLTSEDAQCILRIYQIKIFPPTRQFGRSLLEEDDSSVSSSVSSKPPDQPTLTQLYQLLKEIQSQMSIVPQMQKTLKSIEPPPPPPVTLFRNTRPQMQMQITPDQLLGAIRSLRPVTHNQN